MLWGVMRFALVADGQDPAISKGNMPQVKVLKAALNFVYSRASRGSF